MSSIYGTNQSWPFPIDPQSHVPIDHDRHYSSQPQSQETLFTQETYPNQYSAPFMPPQNINFTSDQSAPLAIPRRQYSGETTTTAASCSSASQQLDPSYFTTPVPPSHLLGSFSPSTPYRNTTLANPNPQPYYISTSPQTNVLSDALGNDTGPSGLKSSPTAIHQGFPFTPPISQPYNQTPRPSNPYSKKHPRPEPHDGDQTGLDGDPAPEPKDGGMKTKPAACTRCKTLKVRCEMKTDTDPCKRCLNAGQPCVTPGRKKRRTPPKREHLLNQIREQAAHIQKLMAQLEERDGRSPPTDRSSSSTGDTESSSPVPSSTSSYDLSDANSSLNVNPDVQDWIAKAKESIEAFGGFIGMGGAAIAQNLLVDEDPEDSESSDEYEDEEEEDGVIVNKSKDEDDDAECGIAIEYSDGEEVPGSSHSEWSKISTVRRSSSGSSLGITSTVSTPQVKKKELTGNAYNQKLSAIPAKTSPFGLMADMLSRKKNLSRKSSEEGADMTADGEVGVARDDFFSASLAPDMKDNLLSQNIVTPQEVEKLFTIYFDYMNISLSLLDPLLYSAKQTYHRSSFLFTVICAIASRYYTERPGLYRQLMHYAQQAAGKALVYGKKSVEVCQGFILLSLYPVPARRWEEDRSWIYLGLAIRLATDLNLHHPVTAKPQNEYHAREMLNRERLWLNCFNLDRSMGSQYGKSPIIKNIDYIACHSEDWWESSEYNIENFDIHICAYNAELRVMSRFNAQIYSDPNHPTSLNKGVDFERLATETDDELVHLGEKWFATLATTDMSNPQNRFRTGLLRLAYSYARLIALSFGFQHHFSKNHTIENPFFLRCLRAASDVVTTVVDDIAGLPNQKFWLRHGPEAQSVFVTFAAAFLVKLLQPKFSSYLTVDKRMEMHTLVQKAIDHLGSPEIAIDNRHGPKLYARFLEGLLASPMARVELPANGLKHGDSLTHKKTRKPKSGLSQSPEPERLLGVPTVASYPANPVVGSSPSPKPSQAALSFDIFAPMSTGHDPFAPASARTRNNQCVADNGQNWLGMNVDYFQQPPFDDNFSQSWQTLASDDSMWNMAPTGLEWMNDLQNVASQDSMLSPEQFQSVY